jgi:molybdate transport system regulatory protein
MIPVALGVGEGADFRAPLVARSSAADPSTLLTLLVIPTIYDTLTRGGCWCASRYQAKAEDGRDAVQVGWRLMSRIRVRVLADSTVAIGPGKADLLDAIAATGSISAAARQMRMSYRRAWILVDTMNTCFKKPLVDTSKGGAEGGGARLTPLGKNVLAHRALATTVRNIRAAALA